MGDTLTVYAKDIVAYLGVFLIVGAATSGITLALTALVYGTPSGTVRSPFTLLGASAVYLFLALTIAVAIINVVIQSLITAAITILAIQRYRGAPVSLRKAFELAIPRFPSVLGASLVTTYLVGAVFGVGLGLLALGLATSNFWLLMAGILLLLAFVPVAIYVSIALSLYAPAIMMEGRPAIAGLKRSLELTRGHRWTLFGALVVVGGLTALVVLAVSLPFLLSVNVYLSGAATIFATGITGAWSIIMAAVAYQLILAEPPRGQSYLPYPPSGTTQPRQPMTTSVPPKR